MKRYLWIFAVLPFLWSCIAEDSSACPQPRGVSVRMSVCPDPMTAVPRAADEEALRDLNFYLLDADGNVVQHRYQSSPTLRFECLPGDYLLRIAANMGRDTAIARHGRISPLRTPTTTIRCRWLMKARCRFPRR